MCFRKPLSRHATGTKRRPAAHGPSSRATAQTTWWSISMSPPQGACIWTATASSLTGKDLILSREWTDCCIISMESWSNMPHYFSEKQDSPLGERELRVFLRGMEFLFLSGGGVFSKERVDKGTAL